MSPTPLHPADRMALVFDEMRVSAAEWRDEGPWLARPVQDLICRALDHLFATILAILAQIRDGTLVLPKPAAREPQPAAASRAVAPVAPDALQPGAASEPPRPARLAWLTRRWPFGGAQQQPAPEFFDYDDYEDYNSASFDRGRPANDPRPASVAPGPTSRPQSSAAPAAALSPVPPREPQGKLPGVTPAGRRVPSRPAPSRGTRVAWPGACEPGASLTRRTT